MVLTEARGNASLEAIVVKEIHQPVIYFPYRATVNLHSGFHLRAFPCVEEMPHGSQMAERPNLELPRKGGRNLRGARATG